MLLFRSEEGVDKWCTTRNVQRGAVMSLDQVWRLSQLWYGDRLAEDFHGRSIAEAEALFHQAGLSGSFWKWNGNE